MTRAWAISARAGTSLSEQAEQLGVETIPLDEFLSLMGWRSESRSVPWARALAPRTSRRSRASRSCRVSTGQPRGRVQEAAAKHVVLSRTCVAQGRAASVNSTSPHSASMLSREHAAEQFQLGVVDRPAAA